MKSLRMFKVEITTLFVGDNGNYPERHDVMIVGNHHAREWMSYQVPMLQLEVIAFSYNNIGYDNDGDGLVDEDSWGDTNGDGILDDDGDCLALATEYQDSNGDGVNCGPGDHGVDEDYSEQWITDLVNAREIYIIPMLNVDGNIYDREVFLPSTCMGILSKRWLEKELERQYIHWRNSVT